MPTALIVEDEPEANRLLALLLQLRGYRTESAFTGGEALEKVGRQPPDVVFLDLMLPDLNGFDVCRGIKARRRTSAIPVVMVTARIASENRRQSFRVGASEYVPKPYTPDQIFGALSAADDWRRDLLGQPDEGEVPLHTHRDVEPFALTSRLGSLLMARTPFDEESSRRITQALSELAQAAIDWGERSGVRRVATIGYRIGPDRLRLAVRDEGGWFSLAEPPRERLDDLIARGRFDDVQDCDGDEIVLSKSFA